MEAVRKTMLGSLWRKLFFSPYYFTIALRKRTSEDILSRPNFQADYILPATYKKWAADPILVDDGDTTYLFYEAVDNEKGRIEVVRIDDDGTVSSPEIVLEDTYHHSYPFVFQYRQVWYMIPESSAREEVRLYKATDFPTKWVPSAVLLRQKAVDTTVFQRDGALYLLTYLVTPGREAVTPQAFRLNLDDGAPSLQAIPWDNYNELECRGAGPVFDHSGMQIRPAQRNQAQRYGDGLLFYRIDDTACGYRETLAGRLDADQVRAEGVWMDGLHTYTRSNKFEAIDIRCREFEATKFFRALRSKLCGGVSIT